MDPSGKVALVTGGAGGLGRAFTKALLTAGAKVVISDVDPAVGQKVVEEFESEFGKNKIIFVKADVTKPSELEEVFKAAKSTFNRLDIVINNAGIMRDSVWEKQVDINVKGVVYGLLLAYKYMGKQNGGAGGLVVNLSSVAGLETTPFLPIYCATKHGVTALTRAYGDSVHADLTGVSVVAVCPGPADTPLMNDAQQYLLHDYLAPVLAEAIKVAGTYNKPEFIAEGLMRAIREGESGSVWLVHDGDISQVTMSVQKK
ncbi:15-hydroxyprostaglandin dehydrogenase [NAD(+)]-like [Schistocerca cancellata]|uniref:15-hydroxyprostaglandin dehydrogenase [NAD(+)]-like n=1 Tax=Schistocerca cancellata TaxID=274614 RepID=UPI002117BCBF|nr:15-hydroxyprostaglandin dehydrogenase [NAD(+)]-like [Schistocerca cancellata]